MEIREYFKSFLLCFCILLAVPLSSARPSNIPTLKQFARMAHHQNDGRFRPDSLFEFCGTAMQRRRLNLTEIKSMIDRTLRLCNNAIVEAQRTGDNYTLELFKENMTTYHSIWPHETPSYLTWIYPNNKRLPKEFGKDLPESYQQQLRTGDLHNHAVELLFDSYMRLLHLLQALTYILRKIDTEGRRQYASEEQLSMLRDTFQKAVDKSNEMLREIRESLQASYECDVELEKLVDERIIQEFQYREFDNWIIFREYANQLQFNIDAFKILLGRINEETNGAVAP